MRERVAKIRAECAEEGTLHPRDLRGSTAGTHYVDHELGIVRAYLDDGGEDE